MATQSYELTWTIPQNIEDIHEQECPLCKKRALTIINRETEFKKHLLGEKKNHKIKIEVLYTVCKSCQKRVRIRHEQHVQDHHYSRDSIRVAIAFKENGKLAGRKVMKILRETYGCSPHFNTLNKWFKNLDALKDEMKIEVENLTPENASDFSGIVAFDGTFPKIRVVGMKSIKGQPRKLCVAVARDPVNRNNLMAAILKGESREEIDHFLKEIEKVMPGKPVLTICDLSDSWMSAISDTWEDAIIQNCIFHIIRLVTEAIKTDLKAAERSLITDEERDLENITAPTKAGSLKKTVQAWPTTQQAG